MTTDSFVLPGIVKGGVIIPQGSFPLPEGTHVEIVFRADGMPPELQAEMEAWERAGDEAWAMIDDWERKEQP